MGVFPNSGEKWGRVTGIRFSRVLIVVPQRVVTHRTANGTAAVAIPAHLAAGIASAVEASRAVNTSRAYAGAFRRFRQFAAAQGLPAIPAAPETAAAYLVSLAEAGRGMATIRMAGAAIAAAHREAGERSPTESARGQRTMRGLAPQAAGITASGLAAILATMRASLAAATPGAARRVARDSALLRVMSEAMLRRSEACSLRWADLSTELDGSGTVSIRRSKTDQLGAGAVAYLGPSTVSALAAYRASLDAEPEPTAPVFGVSPSPVTSGPLRRRQPPADPAARIPPRLAGSPAPPEPPASGNGIAPGSLVQSRG